RVLGRLLDALAGRVVEPAVIAAPQAVALDPAGGELHPTVRAPEREQLRRTPRAAVQGEVLAHQPDGHRVSGQEVLRQGDWLPEPAHESAGQGFGAGGAEDVVAGLAPVAARVVPLAHRRHRGGYGSRRGGRARRRPWSSGPWCIARAAPFPRPWACGW